MPSTTIPLTSLPSLGKAHGFSHWRSSRGRPFATSAGRQLRKGVSLVGEAVDQMRAQVISVHKPPHHDLSLHNAISTMERSFSADHPAAIGSELVQALSTVTSLDSVTQSLPPAPFPQFQSDPLSWDYYLIIRAHRDSRGDTISHANFRDPRERPRLWPERKGPQVGGTADKKPYEITGAHICPRTQRGRTLSLRQLN